jgi:hypothetical protein
MNCTRSRDAIQELVDGTLGPIRVAELEQHLDECPACRALADDLRRLRDTAASLDRPQPPDHVWLQIAGRLRQEGRVQDLPAATVRRRPQYHWPQYRWLAAAAALLLVVGASALYLIPRFTQQPAIQNDAGNAAAGDVVQSGVEDLKLAEKLLQSGIQKLKEGAGTSDQALPPDTVRELERNLEILNLAIADSSAAVQRDPQNVAARSSLFDLLQQKATLIRDTMTLMNEMRKGNAAGAAQVFEGKS